MEGACESDKEANKYCIASSASTLASQRLAFIVLNTTKSTLSSPQSKPNAPTGKQSDSPCYEKDDPQRLPGDGKQEQSDCRAEGNEGTTKKHRRRHFG